MKKVSIIIPAYGTEKYIRRCLDSVINQTYKNLEIIVVNDGSKGNMKEILEEYKNEKRLKVVNHDKNRGLFQARLTGSEYVTGDYIAFIDSDDYISCDYFRLLVKKMEEEPCDILFSNIVIEDSVTNQYIYNFFNNNKNMLKGEEILNKYFKQEGMNYSWHTVWNKIYTKELWDKCKDYYKAINTHLIMTEDFAFSTVLFSKAQAINFANNAYYFYCSNEDASTSLTKMTSAKLEKNIKDIITSFTFVENYLKEVNLYKKYKNNFLKWKYLYYRMWYDRLVDADEETRKSLIALLKKSLPSIENEPNNWNIHQYYQVQTKYNDNLEKLKSEIISPDHKIISFDIFDTLIKRPFYEASDMFYFLNYKFQEVFNTSGFLDFSNIRKESEALCRDKFWKKNKQYEITLDDIYDFISEHYKLSRTKLEKVEKAEIELEIKFCKKREIGYELLSLAEDLNKKIVYTSDMYLDKNTIEKILKNNGYPKKEIYLSSEVFLTKSSGKLYNYLLKKEKVKAKEVFHIGDNYESDYKIPLENGLSAFHLPKAIDALNNKFTNNNYVFSGTIYNNMNNYYIDNHNFLEYMGNRISLAMVANKFFDNPFVPFHDSSDFNCDAYMIGYYAVGMHLFVLSKWLLDSTSSKYDTLSFMARDGKLLYDNCLILKNIYEQLPEFKYIYISRQALIPAMLFEKINFYRIIDYVKYNMTTPKDIIDLLSPILKKVDFNKTLNKAKIKANSNFSSREDFQKFINFILDNLYDENKHKEYMDITKKYFNDNLKGKVANFDIGYSGQPEFILSKLCKKPIDTYFIHCNNEAGFYNSHYGKYQLNTFYSYRPVFTGTLREYILSDSAPSCKGYQKINDEVVPIFKETKEENYFLREIMQLIQQGACEFTKDLVAIFGNDIHNISFEKYYMSLPFEYYLHLSQPLDREIFKSLEFDENIGESLNMLNFWKSTLQNNNYYQTNENFMQSFYNYTVKGRSKFVKGLYYLFFDRVSLKIMVRSKFKEDSIILKMLTKFYGQLKKFKHRRR